MSPIQDKRWTTKYLLFLPAALGALGALWALEWGAQGAAAQGPVVPSTVVPPTVLPVARPRVGDGGAAAGGPKVPTALVPLELPPLRVNEPRPEKGHESVGALLNSLSNTDSAFEIVIGQSR